MTAGRPRTLPPQPDVDIRQIIQEAQNRWLRPIEVCEILRNYKLHNFKLNPVPPIQPQSGSLFLFDRKALRYFRKDGHNWRKKKDGKTVREAHERLKAGSIDVLHCYYAHGEENPNFQRRAYWMLDAAYEHIVLVHYREVTENNRSCVLRNMHDFGATERASNATSSVALRPQPTQFTHSSVSSMGLTASSMASPETVEMPGASHSPELEDVDSAEPDELEEAVTEVVSDQSGLQPSLLEQLTDRQQVPGHRQLGSEGWQSGLRNTNNLGGVNGQMNPGLFSTQEDYKPSFADLQQRMSQRAPSASNFPHSGEVSSMSRQFSDMLDSPGPYSASQQGISTNPLDLSAWAHLMENGRGSGVIGNAGVNFVKTESNNTSPWAEMLREVTTPSTRSRLLEGAGLAPGLASSPLGRHTSHPLGGPVPPKGKGIVDALSPRNLGREPQSALEADLRDVTEKKVLKEAEEKAQAQRNRWQMAHADSHRMDVSNVSDQRTQAQSGAQQMNGMSFGEADTLGALVRSGQMQQQESGTTFSRERLSWLQPQQQNPNEYEHQSQHNVPYNDPRLQVAPPPPQQNNFFLENSSLFSPTVEHLLKDVRSDEVGNLGIMENYKKLGSFGKLDSFGRWMTTSDDISEIPPMVGTSGSLWDSGYQEDTMAGVAQQMDEGSSPTPSLSEQLFNIIDFCPDWGSSVEDTKVIISGSFVKAVNRADHKWCCMFGAVEVPAELIGEGSFCCKAPPHEPGTFPFYITCGNRQACSQVREFEYRSPVKPSTVSLPSSVDSLTKEELLLKIRLARMLFGHANVVNNGRIGNRMQTFEERDDDAWKALENMVYDGEKTLGEVTEQLLQVIFNHKLQEWLQIKSQMTDGRGPSVHDDRGQGVPHFMAGLGYVWSVGPLFASGIPVNFRDSSGCTALHWAAKYGREKMVVALLDAGAVPVLASDPSHKNPRGETAADLASAGGHGGIAAYLAEKSLTERLSGLTLKEDVLNEIDKMNADMEGHRAVAQLKRRTSIVRTVREVEDQVTFSTSLEAVRQSTQASTLILQALRQDSLRRRAELSQNMEDEYGLSSAQMHNFLAARKIQQAYRGHQKRHQMRQHLAATRIQQKFRGWRGRKEFKTMRQRIIRLQAHVRGRIVRNHYKKIIWSVSIVEKVVLRWLRKRKGLRGYQSARALQEADEGSEDLIKEGRAKQKEAVEEEVQKVREMARQKSDRDQYTRLREEERRASTSKNELNDFLMSPREYME